MEIRNPRELSNEELKERAFIFNSGVEEGKKHSSTSPETIKHLENMNQRIDEGFLRIEKKVEDGFDNNSKEHNEIKDDRIRPLELWKSKVEGIMLGAGKSVSTFWVIVVLVGGWVVSPLISSYVTKNSYQKMEQTISSQVEEKTETALILKAKASAENE